MKSKKLLMPLLIAITSLSVISCKNTDKEERAVSPYELMWFYPFDEDRDINQPNYDMRSAYHKVNLSGHKLTSFDEEEKVTKFIHGGFGTKRILSAQFKKTDNYITITCGNFGRPMTELGIITVYDNGCVSSKLTPTYYKDRGEYFFKAEQADTDKLFKIVEEDLAKIEKGERHYYEDIKQYCSLDKFLETADADLARESDYCNLETNSTHPYRVATGYISYNYSDSGKMTNKQMVDMIKATPHTFKGYKSVDYDAISNSLLAIEYNDEYASYAYVLEGGCNFTIAGVTKVYGDYQDGNYHFLVAEYEISSEAGEAMYDAAYARVRDRNY